MFRIVPVLVAVAISLIAAPALRAQTAEPRIALVIGNGGYGKGPLPTALNDAGLVAEALRSVGFDIIEGGDLSQPDMAREFREFLGKVQQAGPRAAAFVYFSGYGFEFEGENYLVAADAKLERDTDIPLDAVRLTDMLRPLAAIPAMAKVVILDSSRRLPFAMQGARLAPGMGAMEAAPGMLIAMSAAPGIVTQHGRGPYGAYATAIAEMVRAPGIDIADAFVRIRTRTHQLTKGAETPWHVSALQSAGMLVPANPATVAARPPPLRQARPMRDIGPEEAYGFAIEQDTLPAYVAFVEAFPRHPFTPRVWAIIRARRETLAWMRAFEINSPQSYWTYLRRYPDGIYAADAERRLRRLSAAYAPPPDFIPVDFYGVPLPLVGEPVGYVYYYPPAPPPPVRLIAPPPAIYVNLAPPPPRQGPRFLPSPAPLPVVPRVTPGVRQPFGQPGGPAQLGTSGRGGPPPTANIPPGGPPVGQPSAGVPRQGALPGGGAPGLKPGPAPTVNIPGPAAAGTPQGGTAAKPPQGAMPTTNVPPPGLVSPNVRSAPPPPPTEMKPSPPRPPPAVVNRPPPTPPVAVNRLPPPPPAGVAPTLRPAVVNRPAPPPPPVTARPPPPAPPQPQAISRPPPPAQQRPTAAAPKPGAPPQKCVVVNGQQVCR